MVVMPFNNCNSNVVKRRGSGKCHTAGHGQKKPQVTVDMFKHLSLSFTDCHSTRNFDQKSSSAQFE
jgi:hypothetical protein